MKQSLLIITVLFLSLNSFSQDCDATEIYSNESSNGVCFDTISNVLMCYSNNYPEHPDGYTSPFTLEAGDYEYSMCLVPDTAADFTPLYEETETSVGCTWTYAFGVGTNGVKYDPNSAEYFETSTGENNIEWHKEARYMFAANFGENGGHLNPFGEYHYHDVPADYFVDDLDIDGTTHSPIVGFAADGFPMYYKYVYSDAMDAESSIIELPSGYSLKSGSRPGDGLSAPDGAYSGLYYEDYEYAPTTLDECNGRYGVTPDYPYGTYYYVLTDNYPYIPRCFKGTFVDHTFRVGPGASCPESSAADDCTLPVYGCMDPFAENYNESANIDNGSCEYAPPAEITLNESTELRLSPNPSTGEFVIQSSEWIRSISIQNALGQIVFQEAVEAEETTIQLMNQPPGLYFVKVFVAEEEKVLKLLIE